MKIEVESIVEETYVELFLKGSNSSEGRRYPLTPHGDLVIAAQAEHGSDLVGLTSYDRKIITYNGEQYYTPRLNLASWPRSWT